MDSNVMFQFLCKYLYFLMIEIGFLFVIVFIIGFILTTIAFIKKVKSPLKYAPIQYFVKVDNIFWTVYLLLTMVVLPIGFIVGDKFVLSNKTICYSLPTIVLVVSWITIISIYPYKKNITGGNPEERK